MMKHKILIGILVSGLGAGCLFPLSVLAGPQHLSPTGHGWHASESYERQRNQMLDQRNRELDRYNRELDRRNRELAHRQNLHSNRQHHKKQRHAGHRSQRHHPHGYQAKGHHYQGKWGHSEHHHGRDHRSYVRDEWGNCYSVDYDHGRRVLKEVGRKACHLY